MAEEASQQAPRSEWHHLQQLFTTPGLSEHLHETLEAIYRRDGPFGDVPLSEFEAYILESSALIGIDGDAQRRLCFERWTGLDWQDREPGARPVNPPTTPAARAAYIWDSAWVLGCRPFDPKAGQDVGSGKLVRSAFDGWVAEGLLPAPTSLSIERTDYEWVCERQAGDWVYQARLYGRCGIAGLRGNWMVSARSASAPASPSSWTSLPLEGAFLENRERDVQLTVEGWQRRTRRDAQKVGAILAYLDRQSARNS